MLNTDISKRLDQAPVPFAGNSRGYLHFENSAGLYNPISFNTGDVDLTMKVTFNLQTASANGSEYDSLTLIQIGSVVECRLIWRPDERNLKVNFFGDMTSVSAYIPQTFDIANDGWVTVTASYVHDTRSVTATVEAEGENTLTYEEPLIEFLSSFDYSGDFMYIGSFQNVSGDVLDIAHFEVVADGVTEILFNGNAATEDDLGIVGGNWATFGGSDANISVNEGIRTGVPVGYEDWYLVVEQLRPVGPLVGDFIVGQTYSGGYVTLSGTAGSYLRTPDSPELDITGDMCVVVRVAADDWTPAADSVLVSKWQTSGQYSWFFALLSTGSLMVEWSEDGTSSNQAYSNVLGLSDGDPKWLAFTMDVDNGSGGKTFRFWWSDDGTSWSAIDAGYTVAGTGALHSGWSPIDIGVRNGGSWAPFAGKVYHTSIRNGMGAGGTVGGTEVFKFDGHAISIDTTTTIEATTGQTIHVVGAGAVPVPLNTDNAAVVGDIEWEDITGYVRGMEWFRGSDDPFGRRRNGEATLTLDAREYVTAGAATPTWGRRFDPAHEYERTKPGGANLIRWGLRSPTDSRNDGWIPVFCGIVDSWIINSEQQADWFATVELVETMAALLPINDNAVALQGNNDTVYRRIDRLLTQANWPYGMVQAITYNGIPFTGIGITLQSTDMARPRLEEVYLSADSGAATVRPDVTGKAWIGYPLRYADSQPGTRLSEWSWITGTNSLRFGRLTLRGNGENLVSNYKHLLYDIDSVELVNDPEHIVNDHRYARAGGTQQLAENGLSIGQFGRKSRARNDLICTHDLYALGLARDDNYLESTTSIRIDSVEVTATGKGIYYPIVAATDLDDGITISIDPQDTPSTVNQRRVFGLVRSMEHRVTVLNGQAVQWHVTYALDTKELYNFPPSARLKTLEEQGL